MDPSKAVTAPKTFPVFLLTAVLAASFLLRFWGVWFGLPHLYHADEPIVVNHALAYGRGDFNPHFFNIPPLTSYLLFVCYGIYFLAGKAMGVFPGVGDFERFFYADPSSFYLIARVVFGVLAGTLSVFLLYRLARRLGDRPAALWSAVFLGVNFLHARDSHYIYADIPLVLVSILAFGVFFRVFGDPKTVSRHLLAGAMIGLAAALKYNGVFFAVPYLWICFRRVPSRKWPLCWTAAGLAASCVFILLNPFALLDWPFFLKEILEQGAANQGGMPWFHHLVYSLTGAFGLPLLALALAGWFRGLVSKDVRLQALAVFALGYYLVLVRWGQPYDRYVLPLVPPLCLLAADLFAALIARSGPAGSFKRSAFAILAVALLIVPSFAKIARWDRLMARSDARDLAKEWIEGNIPPGARIAIDHEFHAPRLDFSAAQLRAKLDRASPAQKRRVQYLLDHPRRSAYELYFLVNDPAATRFLFAEPALSRHWEALEASGIEYVVLGLAGDPGAANDPFLKRLGEQATIVKEFSPYRDGAVKPSEDRLILTGGPFTWEDIVSRKRNGFPIVIYKLTSRPEKRVV